jgi:hypothetical protein
MPETKKQLDIFGKMTDVADVPIVESSEVFNTYKLEDGAILKVKNVATSIVRVEGQFFPLPDGRPVYLVFTSPVVNVDYSPLTKKQ